VAKIPSYLIPLLRKAACETGNYSEIFAYIEEDIKMEDLYNVEDFLKWIVDNNRTFGSSNLASQWELWSTTNKQRKVVIPSIEEQLKNVTIVELKLV
jgi:hypothetical protein